MESKDTVKEINESSAFAYLQDEIKKERKKTQNISLIGSSLFLFIAILGYLTFGPFQIPVLSHLGSTIIGRDSNKDSKNIVVEKVIDDKEEPEEGTVAGEDTIIAEEVVEQIETTTPTTTKKTTTTTVKKTTPTPTSTPEPQPEVRKFACTEDTMQGYVNVMCTNFSFIGQSEAHLTPSARIELYNDCRISSCSLISAYPDLLLKCEDSCLDWVEEQVEYYEGSIQEYISNIQYYSNLLISCGWEMFEVDELKETLLIKCVY